ncbi:hypothetical protein CKAH01_18821 [Colletotrichum kahawae]|uniref:Uncharacterized protein n=1 Tax=Colletotrichum kahawae TaxID=34407 RepID=A0AAD9Y461_COLKA|nr:hypothetical protein CKAH01_18821 [Colletotrichum kahawae]
MKTVSTISSHQLMFTILSNGN